VQGGAYLTGVHTVVRDSYVSCAEYGGGLYIGGDDSVVEWTVMNECWQGEGSLFIASNRVRITDNKFVCGDDCVLITGDNNIFARNSARSNWESATAPIIVISGSNNLVNDNNVFDAFPNGTAMLISGTGNIIRGTFIKSPTLEWPVGIEFTQDGNAYGNNHVTAVVPFELGGTVQTDLGGNVGL
jgi:hypothetical protein